jgi:hypothetical protein
MLGTTALAGSSALPPLPRFPMSIAANNTDHPLVLIVDAPAPRYPTDRSVRRERMACRTRAQAHE